jgi:hypothetical protein
MRLLKSIILAAESKRQAHYQLQLLELDHGAGYVIAKQSGPAGIAKSAES